MTSVKFWINKEDGIHPLTMCKIFLDKEIYCFWWSDYRKYN